MKLIGCLLTILGFFGCTEKTEEQLELEEIVSLEPLGNKDTPCVK